MDDPLWVPLLTHYRPRGSATEIDGERMAAHIKAIRPSVRQFLLAGSTGDGWEMDQDAFRAITALGRRADVFEGTRILFGVCVRPRMRSLIAPKSWSATWHRTACQRASSSASPSARRWIPRQPRI
jgi:4-hydroxy-tetrahydrodipicolinate synthase